LRLSVTKCTSHSPTIATGIFASIDTIMLSIIIDRALLTVFQTALLKFPTITFHAKTLLFVYDLQLPLREHQIIDNKSAGLKGKFCVIGNRLFNA
jgi:hypothetical protein